MSQSPSSLQSFGVETHTPAPVAVAGSAALVKPREDDDSPALASPDTEYGLETLRPQESVSLSGSCPSANRHQVRWIIAGGLQAYVEEHNDGDVFRVPQTYDAFDAMDPIVQKVDSTATGKNTYGWGISGRSLEQAFRTLSGGGRYNASKYKVIPCGDHPWILSGPEGTLLCSLSPVDRPEAESKRATTTKSLSGHSVPVEEENQRVLLGVKRLDILLRQLDKHIVEHTCPAATRIGGKHQFTTEEDNELKIATKTLLKLADLTDDPAQVAGTGEDLLETPTGKPVSLDNGWGGPDNEVFAVDEDDKVLAGWRWEWDNPSQSPEMVGGVAAYWLTTDYNGYTLHRELNRVHTRPAGDS